MHDKSGSVLVIFPGALGDFICALPALLGIQTRYAATLVLVARPALLEVVDLPDCVGISIDRREIADLFVTGAPLRPDTQRLLGPCRIAYSWSGFGDATFAGRLADATGGDVQVFPFRDLRPSEHAADFYARCASVAPGQVPAALFREDPAFLDEMRQLNGPLLVVQPGSGSPRKNWQGFAALLAAWRARHSGSAVVLQGPAELETGVGRALGAPCLSGLSLPQVAALLRCAAVYVGNDAGISHLAGAAGTPSVVLFGDTDPGAWAPRGPRVRVLHAPRSCRRCGPEVLCEHRLRPARVLAAAEAML